jgi:hypothetical protein
MLLGWRSSRFDTPKGQAGQIMALPKWKVTVDIEFAETNRDQ